MENSSRKVRKNLANKNFFNLKKHNLHKKTQENQVSL